MTFYEYLTEFTRVYRENMDAPAAIREARCLAVQSRYEFIPMEEGDLLAGRKRVVNVGFSNEPLLGRSVSWFLDEDRALLQLEEEGADEGQVFIARELLAFWKTQETRAQIRARFPEEVAKALPENIYWEHSQVAFPLYRVVGAYMDYDRLLKLGIRGMKELVRSHGDGPFHEACLIALDSFSDICRRYARDCADPALGEALEWIAEEPPRSFPEALQLMWLYSLRSGVLNYGRMDDYMGPFLEADLRSGKITEERALELLCSLWLLIDARKTVFHGRVIIGGKGRKNEKSADRFAILAMEATRRTAQAEPQLSLRFYEGQDEALMDKALEVIGEGKLYPMLYNDDVNIPSVMKAFQVTEQEAEDYVFFGCGEYVLNKRSIGSPNGIINLLKALEVTLFDGFDLRDKKALGLKKGRLTDFDTFEDLYDAYKEQLRYYIRALAIQQQLEYDVCGEVGEFLYISMLMEGCIERGKGICSGGVTYLGGTLETYGNINTTNSLYAIKDVVYDRKLISRERLLEALEANFEGFEAERQLLLSAEKYGNDCDGVDTFAADLHEFVCNTVREMRALTRLHSYLVVIINNEANTVLGRFTAASADGRKAYEPMANANNPVGGTDKSGITAMLNSLTKLRTDIHAGAVQNMAFSFDLFSRRELVKALLMTYFKNGGQQAMINVLRRGALEEAMRHPEKHQNLMVRVGGFSARFVTLSPDVQREIASRTLY